MTEWIQQDYILSSAWMSSKAAQHKDLEHYSEDITGKHFKCVGGRQNIQDTSRTFLKYSLLHITDACMHVH